MKSKQSLGISLKLLFISSVVVLSVVLLSSSNIQAQGAPTPITDCQGLQNMKLNLTGHYVLANDINCSQTKTWNGGQGFEPVGSNTNSPFVGSFNGRGYRILNLYINRPSEMVGVFGVAKNSEVIDVNLIDVNLHGAYVGALVGWALPGTVIHEVDVQGKVFITRNPTSVSPGVAGGLVGRNEGIIRQSSAKAGVKSQGTGAFYVGGLVGLNYFSGIILESTADGIVQGDGHLGGLVGTNLGTINNTYSSVEIIGSFTEGGFLYGGLAGINDKNGRILNSYAIGRIKTFVPIVINLGGTGGLVGRTQGGASVSNSYWDTETSGQPMSSGSPSGGKSTADMQNPNTYASWNFNQTWTICHQTPDYPRLKIEGEACFKKILKSSVQASSPFIDGDEIYWEDVSVDDPQRLEIFYYNLLNANTSSFHFNASSSRNKHDFTPTVSVYNPQTRAHDSAWIDGKSIQLQGINWSEFSMTAQNSVNWSDFTVMNHAHINWDDINQLNRAGINWGAIERLNEGGLNWTDTQVLQQACARPPLNAGGINWTDLQVLANYTDLYTRTGVPIGNSEFRGKGSQLNPDISARKMVWEDNIAGAWDIYLYDFVANTIKRITPCNTPNVSLLHYKYPKIDGNKIVWQDFRNGNWDIYLYDLGTNQERTVQSLTGSHQQFPEISGNRVAFLDNRDGSHIYVYDLGSASEKRLTTVQAERGRPSISGNFVVWQDKRFGNWDIFLYDLSTDKEWQLTKHISDQMEPSISGNRIVWVDTRNRKKEIYIYQFPRNRAPIWNVIENKQVNEQGLLEFPVSATDPEGKPLCLACEIGDGQSLANMGASFIGASTPTVNASGLFRWSSAQKKPDNNEWYLVFKSYEAFNYNGNAWNCELPANPVLGINWTDDSSLADADAVFIDVKAAEAAPQISNGRPTGVLSAGTTQATLGVNTNVNANCKYATAQGIAFNAMPGVFASTGTMSHSSQINVMGNTAYSYYVRCSDRDGNVNTTDYGINFSVSGASTPTVAPVISNGRPAGNLPAGTTQTIMSINTDVNAACKYGPNPGNTFDALPNAFASTGTMTHSQSISGINNNASFNYFARCRNQATGIVNTSDYNIKFCGGNVDCVPPTAVTDFRVKSSTQSSVSLAWNASTDDKSRVAYRIFRNGVSIAGTTLLNFTDSGLSPATTYTYTIHSYDSSPLRNASAMSAPITATTTPR